ncbi:MAG: hypothetical protein WC243_04505 [Patescibacteria group bacterium]|jgi:hypothetical protein
MSESLPVLKRRSPLKVIGLVLGLLVVLSAASYLVFSFKTNLKGLLSKGPEASKNPVAEMDPIPESPFSFDSKETTVSSADTAPLSDICDYYSCMDLSGGEPALSDVSDCVSKYSELNAPKKPFVEKGVSVSGVIEDVDTNSETVTFSNGRDFDLSNVKDVIINGFLYNSKELKGSL